MKERIIFITGIAAAGKVTVSGSLVIVEVADNASAAGIVVTHGAGSIAEDNDTLSATGTAAQPGINGSADLTEADDVVTPPPPSGITAYSRGRKR